jgi:uncharacterized protein
MKTKMGFSIALLCLLGAGSVVATDYQTQITDWRARAEASLRKDTGWLTLAGRWPVAIGTHRLGSAADNEVVLPAGTAPDRLGVLTVRADGASLSLAEGLSLQTAIAGGEEKSGQIELTTDIEKQQWLHRGRLALTVFKHPVSKGMILRIADQENPVRKDFAGRVWFDVQTKQVLDARFIAAKTTQKIEIVNVLGEVSQETVAGVFEFQYGGKTQRLTALGEPKDNDLFIIFSDATSGKSTYASGRFLSAKRPVDSAKASIDFNKAHNPPCAFSAYTSCPLPPKENQLTITVAAGEKMRS